MEATPRLKLSELNRDWIDGISASSFYRRVSRRIDKIAACSAKELKRGVLIAEIDPIKFSAAFMAALHLEVPIILANPHWRKREWQAVGDQVSPGVVYGQCPRQLTEGQAKECMRPYSILIPTGGSSGSVKFAVHSWSNLVTASQGLAQFLGEESLHACCMLPLYHVSGIMQLVRTWTTGGRLFFISYKAFLCGERPDFDSHTLCLSLVPTQLHRLVQDPSAHDYLSRVRAIFVGGAAVQAKLAEQAYVSRLPIVLSYGMTETAGMVTALPIADFLSGQLSSGQPLPHATIKVITENGRTCSVGTIGRIEVQTQALFLGYQNCNSSNYDTSTFLTDDQGFVDMQGKLHVLGRIDRIINSGAEKIDPKEVESVLLGSNLIKEVLVVGWPDAEWGERLVAIYTSSKQVQIDEELESWMRNNLAAYKRPKLMLRVDQLPLTENGKILHRELKKLIIHA
jgi:O-succinylbenzoic acid--CoA ligase